jgi:hypothetical protein
MGTTTRRKGIYLGTPSSNGVKPSTGESTVSPEANVVEPDDAYEAEPTTSKLDAFPETGSDPGDQHQSRPATAGSGTLPDGDVHEADHQNKVNAKRRRPQAIGLLATGTPVAEVARTIDVDRSTVHRWLSDPDFAREVAERRQELIEKTFDLQIYASLQATRKLLELLDSDDPRIVFWSARTLAPLKDAYMNLDHERRIRRMEDLDEYLYTRTK